MATFVGAATNQSNGNASSISVDVPAGTQDGDVIVAAAWFDTDVDITPPAGWTEILTAAEVEFAGARMFYRVASSEPASYTWSRGTNQQFAYGAGHFTFRDISTSDPIAAAAKKTDATPSSLVTAPSVTTDVPSEILTFCTTHRDTGTIVLHSTSDAGTELADWGALDDNTPNSNSGAVYHTSADPGTYAFHVDLSGSGHDAVALYTVALNSSGVKGDLVLAAPVATIGAEGSLEVDGAANATAPISLLSLEAITNLVRGDVAATAPLAKLLLSSVNLIEGQLTPTAPLARAQLSGRHDVFGSLAATAPAAKLLMGAETRIFGARIVVVRPESRVRYPF